MDVIFVYIYQVIYINVHIKVEKQLPGKLLLKNHKDSSVKTVVKKDYKY